MLKHDSVNKNTFSVINPATLKTSSMQLSTREEIEKVVTKAQVASKVWAQKTLKERIHLVSKLGYELTKNREEGSALIREETGRSKSLAALSELNNVMAFIKLQ